jgi:hypothetical protein
LFQKLLEGIDMCMDGHVLMELKISYEEFCLLGNNMMEPFIFQKIELFITTTVRTPNPTEMSYMYVSS